MLLLVCVWSDLCTYMQQYDTMIYAQLFPGLIDTLTTCGSRQNFAAKSENSLFGTLALVALRIFGGTEKSFQGARRVDLKEGVGSVVEREVSGRVSNCFRALKSILFPMQVKYRH